MSGNTWRLGIPRLIVVTFISSSGVLPLITYTLSVFTANSQTGLESGNLSHIPPPGSISSLPLMSGLLTTSSLTNTNTTPVLDTSVIPTISSLLCTQPTSSAALAKAAPLILSSALPPIPARAVAKIRNGSFIDLKDLLVDNQALMQRLQEVNPSGIQTGNLSKLRDIQDPLTWIFCFLSFIAAKTDSSQIRDLLAYGQIIIQMARKHGGNGWKNYDYLFRQQLAAGSNAVWSEVNPSLMASTVLGMGTGTDAGHRLCTLCMGSDHWQAECALNSLEGPGNKSLVRPVSSNFRLKPYKSYDDICRRFNWGSCSLAQHSCKYDHTCNRCYKPGHGAFECPKGKNRSPVTESVTVPNLKGKP